MAQTSYTQDQAIGIPGQLSDLSFHRISTALNKEGAAIPFGVALVKATGGYDLPDNAADKVSGIALHHHAVDQRDLAATGSTGIPADGVMNVLEEGCCYVLTEDEVADGADVFARIASGAGGTQLGAFRGTAVTNETIAVKGAKFRRGAAAGGLAEIEFSKLVNLS